VNRNAFVKVGLSSLALAPVAANADTPLPARTPIAPATPPAKKLTHEDVRRVIAANRKIVSPDGIEELRAIDVNGCKEWICVRGRDRRNPILLYIHGGPGAPAMPESWTFQSPWEDYFTVVQWDQRGAGKTYASNDPQTIAPTMNGEQMIADAQRVVRYLLDHYKKEKIFVLGHSWGSYVGLEVTRRNPELLHAYVGTGQMIDTRQSEAEGYAFALQQARLHGNAQAVKELEALAPYPGPVGALTADRIDAQRKWLVFYGGLTYGRSQFDYDDADQFAPEYTDDDVRLINKGSLFSLDHLIGVVERTNFESLNHVACPLFIFQGEHDSTTSYAVVESWFERLQAPKKLFVTFRNSSHMAMFEQPGAYLDMLIEHVRPIAAAQGDVAPASVTTAIR
jgi:pimeloyl-ACP methyl ester carboxylesterase